MDLGMIILAFAAYYSVLALLFVLLISFAAWAAVTYLKHASARHRGLNDFAKGFHKGKDFMSPPATLAT